jgi:hypothetical protein
VPVLTRLTSLYMPLLPLNCTHTLQGSAGYIAAAALCDSMRELELTLPGKAPASNPHADAQEAEGIRGLRKVCISSISKKLFHFVAITALQ